jgi:hypothetical protein
LGATRNEVAIAGSALYVGRWPIVPLCHFIVPSSCRILVLNWCGLARNLLLTGRSLRGLTRLIMGGEGFRKDVPHFVSPPTVVLYNLIMDIGHGCSPEIPPS